MEIKVYAHLSKEQMWDYGKEAGLTDEAVNHFMYLNEVELVVSVDAENGAVCDIKVDEEFRSRFK